MTEKLQQTLRDSAGARWAALILIALMMFFAYMFVDVMSPLQTLIESERGWTPNVFGTYRYHPRQMRCPVHRYFVCFVDGSRCSYQIHRYQ